MQHLILRPSAARAGREPLLRHDALHDHVRVPAVAVRAPPRPVPPGARDDGLGDADLPAGAADPGRSAAHAARLRRHRADCTTSRSTATASPSTSCRRCRPCTCAWAVVVGWYAVKISTSRWRWIAVGAHRDHGLLRRRHREPLVARRHRRDAHPRRRRLAALRPVASARTRWWPAPAHDHSIPPVHAAPEPAPRMTDRLELVGRRATARLDLSVVHGVADPARDRLGVDGLRRRRRQPRAALVHDGRRGRSAHAVLHVGGPQGHAGQRPRDRRVRASTSGPRRCCTR